MSDTPRTDAIQLSGGGAATLLSAYYLLCCGREREFAQLQKDYDLTTEVDKRVHAQLQLDKAEFDAMKAKLAKYENAVMPEEPNPQTVTGASLEKYTNNLRAFAIAQVAARQAAEKEMAKYRDWLDNNTTFYNVDADWPVEAHNVPVLAQVSTRIWYHATDDEVSYPFSKVIDAALAAEGEKHGD